MSAQKRPGSRRMPSRSEVLGPFDNPEHAQHDTQPSLFSAPIDPEQIAARLTSRFPMYGRGTDVTPHNALSVTLQDAQLQFGFGVPVLDVVRAVLELAGLEVPPA